VSVAIRDEIFYLRITYASGKSLFPYFLEAKIFKNHVSNRKYSSLLSFANDVLSHFIFIEKSVEYTCFYCVIKFHE